MKKVFGILKQTNVWMLLLMVAMALFGVTDVSMAVAVDGTDGVGKHMTGDALNTETINTESPDLIVPDVDDRITKISPYKNPIDQIARLAGRKMKATGMEYEHYSIDIAPIEDVTLSQLTESGSSVTNYLPVSNPDLFNVTDTITVKGVKGYDATGANVTTKDLMLYVAGKDSSSPQKLLVYAINGKLVSSKITVPTIPSGTTVFMLSTAAAEEDVRSYTNSSLPTPETGYCQIYKMEVGETTIAQMTNKKVKWDLNDQIEIGVNKLRAGIEKSSAFGIKGKTTVAGLKSPVYTTGGIYWDIDKSFSFPENPTDADMIDFSKYIFKGQSGSDKKIMLMGSDFNASLSKVPGVIKQLEAKNTEVWWGLTWNMITTNFGTLLAKPYDILDTVGRSNECIIIDPDYLDKWTLIPFGSTNLDLKTSGLFNGDVNVTTEVSSICLRYKNAHCKAIVVASIPVTGITTSGATHALAVGATYNFAATNTIEPTNASNKTVTYVSSAPAKATVNSAGLVSGIVAGTAVISAITANGNVAFCTVTVS